MNAYIQQSTLVLFLIVSIQFTVLGDAVSTIGYGAPWGQGSPLQWSGDIGPLSGGYNGRCAIADFDRDGDADIVVNYPFGGGAINTMWGLFYYKNTGEQNLAAVPIFESPRRLDFQEEQFAIPLAYDWNRDGLPDLIVDGILYINIGEAQFVQSEKIPHFPKNTKCLLDWNADNVIDCLVSDTLPGNAWPSPAVWQPDEPPYTDDGIWKGGAFRNTLRLFLGTNQNGDIAWLDQGLLHAGGNELEVYGEADPVWADWDRDGDADLIVGAQTELIYFENIGNSNEPLLQRGKRIRVGDAFSVPGLFLRPALLFGTPTEPPDLILAQESGCLTLLRFHGLDPRSVPSFSSEEELMQRNPLLDAGCLSVISVHDWDNDQDLDIISGNSYGEVLLFENEGNTENPKFQRRQRLTADGIPIVVKGGANGSIQGPGEAHFGYTCPVVIDWNRDSAPDLILSDIWGKYTYYERDKKTYLLKRGVPICVEGGRVDTYKPSWVWQPPQDDELVTQWRCQPAVVDWDGDGIHDLITLDSEGFLALFRGVKETAAPVVRPPQRAFLYENESPIRITPGKAGRSGRARIVVVDWDQDGDRDIVRGCTHAGDHDDPRFADYERAAVWYENQGDDQHFRFRGCVLHHMDTISFCGHATSPAIVDWDNDGKLDLLLGTEDGLIYFFANEVLIKPNDG